MCFCTSVTAAEIPSREFHSSEALKKGQWQIEGNVEKQSDKMFRRHGFPEKVSLTWYVQSKGKEQNLRGIWK